MGEQHGYSKHMSSLQNVLRSELKLDQSRPHDAGEDSRLAALLWLKWFDQE